MVSPSKMIISVSFISAFILSAVPMPWFFSIVNIPWVAVVLAYWCVTAPEKMGVISAWLIGLLFDILNGAVLGQHGLGFALVAYLSIFYQHRFKFAPPVQQVIFITLVILLYRGLTWQIYDSFGTVIYRSDYIWSAFSAPVVWIVLTVAFSGHLHKNSL